MGNPAAIANDLAMRAGTRRRRNHLVARTELKRRSANPDTSRCKLLRREAVAHPETTATVEFERESRRRIRALEAEVISPENRRSTAARRNKRSRDRKTQSQRIKVSRTLNSIRKKNSVSNKRNNPSSSRNSERSREDVMGET